MADPKLTVCMIARDEEATIALALDSLYLDRPDADPALPRNDAGDAPIWDELIVLLAGESTDNTELIAKAYGAKVAIYPAPDGRWPVDAKGVELRNYGEAREACEALATGEYVLWIDGDERLVEGHKLIRAIVEQGLLPGVRPKIRALNSNRLDTRQELLHKRGRYRWRGAIHEWLEGMPVPVENGIVYEEIARPGGDRPHGDMFELLRGEMGLKLDTRQLYYIGREHLNASVEEGAAPHWAEAVACCKLFLEARGGWPERRAQVAVFMAQAWEQMQDEYQARLAYLRAIEEWGNWAEPYYALSCLAARQGLMQEALGWASAALWFKPTDECANLEIYEWRRYEQIAFCLARIGQYAAAVPYYERVMAAHPNDVSANNLKRCREMMQEAVPA